MKSIFFILTLLTLPILAQKELFGATLQTTRSEVIEILRTKNVEFVETGAMLMVEQWSLGEFTLVVDFEFDAENHLQKIYAQSDEVASSQAELDIPQWFRKINRLLQDEFGLPESRKNIDLASTPQTEMHLLREWDKEEAHVELGLLHMEDVFAVSLRISRK